MVEFASLVRSNRGKATFSETVIDPKSAAFWNETPINLRIRLSSASEQRTISTPLTVMLPDAVQDGAVAVLDNQIPYCNHAFARRHRHTT